MRFREISFKYSEETWDYIEENNIKPFSTENNIMGILTLVTKEGFPKPFDCTYKTFLEKLKEFNKAKEGFNKLKNNI